MNRKILNIAHRGASGRCPENTLSAFDAAIADGADMCELDVQLTRDGAAVVIHDESVDRTTAGHGAVASMTLAEIKRLDASGKFGAAFKGEHIPTLDEVLALTKGRCGLNIELKAAGVERQVCELINSHDVRQTSIVSSFDWDSLARVRTIDPAIRLGVLAEEKPDRMLEAAARLSAIAINPRFDLATGELCAAAHKDGVKVYVWTVDAPEAMRLLIANGVDGIMTNYPDRMREVQGG